MRLMVIAVGRAKAGFERAAFDDYATRLKPLGAGLGLGPLGLVEVEAKRRTGDPKVAEGASILAALPSGARLVALDETGQSPSSAEFARELAHHRDDGVSTLAFAIGGADGLDPAVRERSASVLALGAMTWPHMLVRVLIAEQLYRAITILSGHPYHRA